MGVIERAKRVTGWSERETDRPQYLCLACESPFDVLHHTCPVCGSYDLRRARWATD